MLLLLGCRLHSELPPPETTAIQTHFPLQGASLFRYGLGLMMNLSCTFPLLLLLGPSRPPLFLGQSIVETSTAGPDRSPGPETSSNKAMRMGSSICVSLGFGDSLWDLPWFLFIPWPECKLLGRGSKGPATPTASLSTSSSFRFFSFFYPSPTHSLVQHRSQKLRSDYAK